MSGSVCFCVCVCGRGRSRKQVGGDRGMNFVLFMVHGGSWGTEDRILDFLGFIFCWFLIFFCLYLWNDSHLKKIVKFFGGDKIVQRYYIYRDGLRKDFFCRKPRCLLFWRILNRSFICYRIKRFMVKTSSQEFITFNKSMIYFYLTSV